MYYIFISMFFTTLLHSEYFYNHNSLNNQKKCLSDDTSEQLEQEMSDEKMQIISASLMTGLATGLMVGAGNAILEKSLFNGFSNMSFFSVFISWLIAGETRIAVNDIAKDILFLFSISYRAKILEQSSYIGSWIGYIAAYRY